MNKAMQMKKKDGFTGEQALVLPASVVSEMENNPITSQLHITEIGFYPVAQHHFRQRDEPISQCVLIYCYAGSGWYEIGGEHYTVPENHFFILPSGCPHKYGSNESDPWTIYWVHFKGKLAGVYSDVRHPIEIKPSLNSRISDRNALFDEMLHTLKMGYGVENICYASSVLCHFLATLKYVQTYRSAVNRDDAESDIMTAAIHYMRENVGRKLSMNDITKYVGYSASHFSMLFKKRTGYSPNIYFNHLKIQKACELLDFTDMKINQICHNIGIEDCYYFSRLFHQIMGISPRQYKSQKKG